MSLKENAEQLQQMIFTGKLLEAFETYYHEDVVMTEIGQAPVEGKAANRIREEQFVGGIEAFHGGGVTHIAYNEASQVAMIESWMDVTFKDGNRVKMSQVAVQEWQGNQVVAERFYHP